MKDILIVLAGIITTGIGVLLCFFCCFLASKSDKYWETLKEEMEKRNGRR